MSTVQNWQPSRHTTLTQHRFNDNSTNWVRADNHSPERGLIEGPTFLSYEFQQVLIQWDWKVLRCCCCCCCFLCFSFPFSSFFSQWGSLRFFFFFFFDLVAAVHRASLSPDSKISVDSDDSDQTSQRSGFMVFLSWLSWSTWISRSLFPWLSSIVLTINIRQHVLFFRIDSYSKVGERFLLSYVWFMRAWKLCVRTEKALARPCICAGSSDPLPLALINSFWLRLQIRTTQHGWQVSI